MPEWSCCDVSFCLLVSFQFASTLSFNFAVALVAPPVERKDCKLGAGRSGVAAVSAPRRCTRPEKRHRA
jgi:hypothetical protein